jgi:hypothetical protein
MAHVLSEIHDAALYEPYQTFEAIESAANRVPHGNAPSKLVGTKGLLRGLANRDAHRRVE